MGIQKQEVKKSQMDHVKMAEASFKPEGLALLGVLISRQGDHIIPFLFCLFPNLLSSISD